MKGEVPGTRETARWAIRGETASARDLIDVTVVPKTAAAIPFIKQQVASLGYDALARKEFMARTSDFYKYQTGLETNILLMTAISFLVGLSISALAETGGRVSGPTGAAARLGIHPSTLESKIRTVKIDKHRFKTA